MADCCVCCGAIIPWAEDCPVGMVADGVQFCLLLAEPCVRGILCPMGRDLQKQTADGKMNNKRGRKDERGKGGS